jgi:hypothetical protein
MAAASHHSGGEFCAPRTLTSGNTLPWGILPIAYSGGGQLPIRAAAICLLGERPFAGLASGHLPIWAAFNCLLYFRRIAGDLSGDRHGCWPSPPRASLVSPCNHPAVACRGSTQPRGIGSYADTPQIQAVSIPTYLHVDIRVELPFAVMTAGGRQVHRLFRRKPQFSRAQFFDQQSTALAMARILPFIRSSCVVEEGKELDHASACASLACQRQPISAYTGPVRGAVCATPRQMEFVPDERDQLASDGGRHDYPARLNGNRRY